MLLSNLQDVLASVGMPLLPNPVSVVKFVLAEGHKYDLAPVIYPVGQQLDTLAVQFSVMPGQVQQLSPGVCTMQCYGIQQHNCNASPATTLQHAFVRQ